MSRIPLLRFKRRKNRNQNSQSNRLFKKPRSRNRTNPLPRRFLITFSTN